MTKATSPGGLAAKLPIRPEHVDTKTAIDGSDPANEPQGWYPFSRNPQSVNPRSKAMCTQPTTLQTA